MLTGYVIKRTDQGGGYLAPSGSDKAYTKNLQSAQPFATFAAADAERCKGNEIVVAIADEMPELKY